MTIRREARKLTDHEWTRALQRREAWAWERLHQAAPGSGSMPAKA